MGVATLPTPVLSDSGLGRRKRQEQGISDPKEGEQGNLYGPIQIAGNCYCRWRSS